MVEYIESLLYYYDEILECSIHKRLAYREKAKERKKDRKKTSKNRHCKNTLPCILKRNERKKGENKNKSKKEIRMKVK